MDRFGGRFEVFIRIGFGYGNCLVLDGVDTVEFLVVVRSFGFFWFFR